MKINVTSNDIQRGKAGEPCWCPVARAIRRAGRAHKIRVSADEERISIGYSRIGKQSISVSTPPKVSRFIAEYDMCIPVEPFTFELNLRLEMEGHELR